MAGFIYWFPGTRADVVNNDKLRDSLLHECGLSTSLADCRSVDLTNNTESVITGSSCGPDGKPGCLVYPKHVDGSDPEIGWGYFPEQQTWLQRRGFWIGWDKQRPPEPEDLERQHVYSSHIITDAHNRRWKIATIRALGEQQCLPVDYYYDADGCQHKAVKIEYRNLWELAGEVFDSFNRDARMDIKEDRESWLVDAALTFLGLNYRVGRHEVTALREAGRGIMDTMWVVTINTVAIDWATYLEHQKKS